ncbi:hypothetical protein [Escherichia coli]|uniref:hypothetical protein n=1 Tax=Escherichia coli TaxID=562 RepID=UPI001FDA9988|nr:hypothetical protein [Escherichia coli]
MHNNVLNVSRSIQTIRDCTSVVASIPLRNSIDELQIRVLNLSQANKQLRFILTLKSETEGIKHSVKVFSEAILLNGKLRHLVRPERQYPDVLTREKALLSEVQDRVIDFVKCHPLHDSNQGYCG